MPCAGDGVTVEEGDAVTVAGADAVTVAEDDVLCVRAPGESAGAADRAGR
jgi:hypothetical protein